MIRRELILANEIKKCPNCGHEFKDGENFCPNCDLFVPVNEQTETDKNLDLGQTKQFKTFKETEIKENKETTDAPSDSLFKHRTKHDESLEDSTEEVSLTPPEEKRVKRKRKQETSVANAEKEEIKDEATQETETKKHTEFAQEVKAELDKSLNPEIETPAEPEVSSTESHHAIAPKVQTENVVPQRTQAIEEQSENKKNKTKTIIGISAAAVLLIGGFTFYNIQQKNTEEKARVALVETTTNQLDSLFSSKEQVFLKEGISQDDLDAAKKNLDSLKTKDGYDALKETYDELEEKFNKQQSINELFKEPIISGKNLATNAFVKNADAVALHKIEEEKDGFDILFNKAFDEAKKQKEALKSIEDKVSIVYKEDAVVKSATRKEYQAAVDAVKSLKDDDMKAAFNTKLAEVDKSLTAAEKKVAAAKKAAEEEQARVAAAQAQTQATTNNTVTNSSANTSSNNTNNNTSTYRWGNRQDATIDYSDPAWAWNPGIKEDVISEVISRGYVVDGGYSLVPKYIENGEGFYDLYATTNSKLFPNSKASEFPLYVVTINAKTGWFKGNGPN